MPQVIPFNLKFDSNVLNWNVTSTSKEDDHLFVKVRARIPEAAGLIDKLEHDHKEGGRHILRLKETYEKLAG